MTSPPPVAVIDALNSLLQAELGSVFRFMGEGSPYLSRATADVRRPLQEMVDANTRHAGELARAIQDLGGEPASRGVRPEEQYLAFLSLKFLLPKLVEEKKLILQRYENALRGVDGLAPPHIVQMLREQQAECRAHLELLKKASDDVIAASRAK
jgi:bacterioferritin (cytochrome b1)